MLISEIPLQLLQSPKFPFFGKTTNLVSLHSFAGYLSFYLGQVFDTLKYFDGLKVLNGALIIHTPLSDAANIGSDNGPHTKITFSIVLCVTKDSHT